MRFLISNDDGIYSPGLAALAGCAEKFGEVRIVAPDVEQSSMGHAITSARPLRYRRTEVASFEAWRVNGTPADCVALGTHHWKNVDAVFSGINLGPNLGNSCWHSGTLAAAKQAALLRIRGIAFSTFAPEDGIPDFERLAPWVEQVMNQLLSLPDILLVNVNFPPEPRGIRWCRQAVQQYDGHVVRDKDPMGRELFWFTVRSIEQPEKDSDRWAFQHQYISITPLRLDITDERALEQCLAHHSVPSELKK